MIKVRIHKTRKKCGGSTELVVMTEGGNVFAGGTADIPSGSIGPTLEKYYEELGLLFPEHRKIFPTFEPVGSVGKKALSGDIDLAIDLKKLFSKGAVDAAELESWNIDPQEWQATFDKFKSRARTLSDGQIGWRAFLTEIAKYINAKKGLIQTDLKKIRPGTMFSLFPQFNEAGEQQEEGVQIDWMVGETDWLRFSYFSDAPSDLEPLVKGLHRTQLLHALFLAKNHSFDHRNGVTNKDTGKRVAFSPDEAYEVLENLYGKEIAEGDLQNFFSLWDWMSDLVPEDKNLATDRYLRILDVTNGNKDTVTNERCGYVPQVLEEYWLENYKRIDLKGRYLCKNANPRLWAAVNGGNQKDAVNEIGMGCGTGDPKGPCPDPKKQSSGTYRVRPLNIGRPINRKPVARPEIKPVKLEEQEAEPSQEFLASLQELIEPFINSDITNPRRLNYQLYVNNDYEDSPIEVVGIGTDKIVFSHTDYPNWVFKVVKANAVKDEAGDEKYVWNMLKDSEFASLLAPVVGYDGTPVYAMRKTSSGGSLEDIKDALYKISSDKYKDFEYYLLADANKSNIGRIGDQSVLNDYDQWDEYFRKPANKLQEQANEEVTVVIPGGFKPPHKGHVEMINHFARLPNVSKVIVYMGSKPRQSADGSVVITKDKSIELFNLFDLASNVEFGECCQRSKKDGGSYENPLNDAADLLFDPEYEGMGVAIGHSEKDPKRGKIFASIAKNAKTPLQANVATVPPAPAVEDLSATDLRNAIENEDLEGMKKFMPDDIIDDYLNILKK